MMATLFELDKEVRIYVLNFNLFGTRACLLYELGIIDSLNQKQFLLHKLFSL